MELIHIGEERELDAWRLERESDISVSSRKVPLLGHVYQDRLVSCVFITTYNQPTMGFDLIVDPDHQGLGLAQELMDALEEEFESHLMDAYGAESLEPMVVNPVMRHILAKRGYTVIDDMGPDEFGWIMSRSF